MRILLSLVLFTVCAETPTQAHRTEWRHAGAPITVHMVGVDGAGVEHAVIRTLI